jgi:lipopolysaccharide biosynthesis protein
MSFLRKFTSLGYWLLDGEKTLSDFSKRVVWNESDLVIETTTDRLMSPLVITAHVFYSDFAIQLIESLKQLPKETKLFATTPSQEIKQYLDQNLESTGNPHDIRKTPNIGRNFGPLLVEFSKKLLQEESFIHVHSKKSTHTPGIGLEWRMRNTDLLLSRQGIKRISSLIETQPKIGLVYVDSSDLIFGINYRWGRSKKHARKLFLNHPFFQSIKWSGKLSFPSGGMFWTKTNAIQPLLELEWSYSMFTSERQELDGTLQHSIERLIGEIATASGYKHGELLHGIDRFKLKDQHKLD